MRPNICRRQLHSLALFWLGDMYKSEEEIVQTTIITQVFNSFLKWELFKYFLHLSARVAYEKNGLWVLTGATEMRGRTWPTALH